MNHEDLDLDNAWSIGEEAFQFIIDTISASQAKRIIEFGSGASTVRLALSFPQATIVSVEHNPKYVTQTKILCDQFLPKSNVKLLHRSLEYQWFGLSRIHTYRRVNFRDPIDCVIVDGPPGYYLRGREGCLYQVYDNLRIGGVVILDDYQRSEERSIVDNWLRAYSDSFSLTVQCVDHSLAVLTKIRKARRRIFVFSNLIDNFTANLARAKPHLRRRITKTIKRLHNSGSFQ